MVQELGREDVGSGGKCAQEAGGAAKLQEGTPEGRGWERETLPCPMSGGRYVGWLGKSPECLVLLS